MRLQIPRQDQYDPRPSFVTVSTIAHQRATAGVPPVTIQPVASGDTTIHTHNPSNWISCLAENMVRPHYKDQSVKVV
jgi:hypothetical protein